MTYQSYVQARKQSGLHNLETVASLAISLKLGITFVEAEQLNMADRQGNNDLANDVVTNRNERLAFYSQSHSTISK
jgi:hypothetical protein